RSTLPQGATARGGHRRDAARGGHAARSTRRRGLLRRRGNGVATDPLRGGEDLARRAGVGLDPAEAHLRADPRGGGEAAAADLAAAGQRRFEDRLGGPAPKARVSAYA